MTATRENIVRFLLGLICVAISACGIAGGGPLNLQVISVEMASASSHPPELHPMDLRLTTPSLVVVFSSEQDLVEYAKDHEFNIGNDTSFCRDGAFDTLQPLQGNPYVFDDFGKVDAFQRERSRSSHPAPYFYRVFIRLKSISLAGQKIAPYDLAANPADICLRIRGGNMSGAKFTSNTIVVSRDAVVRALSSRLSG